MKYSLLCFDESAHLAADDFWHSAIFFTFFHANLLMVLMVVLFK